MGLLSKIFRVAAPIAGGLAFGPAGALAGGALAGGTKKGGNVLRNALGGTAAAVPAAVGGGAIGGAAKGGLLGRIFGAAGRYGPELAQAGIAGYGALEGARAQRAGERLQNRALDMAQQEYAAGAPLRERQRQLLLQGAAPRPDLSYAYRSTENPWG